MLIMQTLQRRGWLLGAVALCLLGIDSAHASTKKGFGQGTKDPHWRQEVKEVHAAWFYNWSLIKPTTLPQGIEFVPMVWGRKYAHDIHLPKHTKYMMGFNEPDTWDQSLMPVDEAVTLWPNLTKCKVKVGSPSNNWAKNPWIQQFMQVAATKKLRVDFICIHYHGEPDVEKFLDLLRDIHNAYHKPIWITEMGVADWHACPACPNPYTVAQVEHFMRAVIPELEKRDYVQKYAWFPAPVTSNIAWSSALFNKDGSLTELGKIYAKY